jgi:hypothetical protein
MYITSIPDTKTIQDTAIKSYNPFLERAISSEIHEFYTISLASSLVLNTIMHFYILQITIQRMGRL